MKKKKNNNIVLKFVGIILCILFIIIVLFAPSIFGEDTFIGDSLGGIEALKDFFVEKFPTIIRTILVIIVIIGLSRIIRFILKAVEHKMKNGKAVINLLNSLIKYIALIILIITVLKLWGVDTSALIASVGILGLIIGLGAQSLIEDVISGLFIVFERTFDVGDVVVIEGFRGTVQEIGVRTTKIIDAGGDIQVINNSDIRKIINMTNDLSLAICDVSIEYGESLERVENVIEKNISHLKERIPAIIDGPYYKGVAELGASGVVIRIIARCNENDKYQTVRDLNREIKIIFDANKINIPFPQVVLNQPKSFVKKTGVTKSANKFVDHQKKLSKHIKDEDK